LFSGQINGTRVPVTFFKTEEDSISSKRNTFAKHQREQDKKHRADKKRAKRAQKKRAADHAIIVDEGASVDAHVR